MISSARRRHQAAGALVAVIVWTIIGWRIGSAFPGPVKFLRATVDLYRSGALIDALAGTAGRLALGYGLAIIVAFPLGAAMGLSPWVDTFVDTYVTTLFVTSVASLLPLLILVAGTGVGFYLTVVFLFSVFHMVLLVRAGLTSVKPGTRDAGRVFGATGWRSYVYVLLPAALPHAVAALRVGYNRAVKGAVVAELWVYAGVGELLHGYQRFSQISSALVVIAHVMLLAVLGARLLRLVERRYAGWREVTVQ